MGVLTASGMMGSDGPSASQMQDQEPADVETQETETPAAESQEKSEFVPFSAVKQPGSRRSKAQEQIDARFKDLDSQRAKEREEYQQSIREQREMVARLSGQLEALQRIPQQQTQTAPAAPSGPSPDDLYREAEAALDKQDMRTYHEKLRQAHRAEAERLAEDRVKKVREEMQRQIPQQMPPDIQFLMSSHKNVALSGQRGIQAVMLKEQELALYGWTQDTPERRAKAFELADKMLAPKQAAAPQFSQDSAAALAAVPTSRPGAGGGGSSQEEGHELTPLEKQTISNLGWTKAEYVKWKYPERFIKR